MRAALAVGALAVGALAWPRGVAAQFRARTELGGELALTRRLEVSVSERALFGEGVPDTGRWQTLVGATFRPKRFLGLGVGYRLSGEAGFGGPRLRHRALVEATLSPRWRSFRLAYRLRFQTSFEDRLYDLDIDPVLRNRVTLRWRSPSPVDVYAGFEVFSDVGGSTITAFDRWRVEGGAVLNLRRFDVGLAYRYDAPFEGDGSRYHTVLASLTWHMSLRALRRGRDRDGDHR